MLFRSYQLEGKCDARLLRYKKIRTGPYKVAIKTLRCSHNYISKLIDEVKFLYTKFIYTILYSHALSINFRTDFHALQSRLRPILHFRMQSTEFQ